MKIFIVTPPASKRGYENARDIIKVIKQLKNVEIVDKACYAEKIVVIGGDGTLLSAIQLYWKNKIPFVGIGRGTKGFLMNSIKKVDQLFSCLNEVNSYSIELQLLKAAFIDVNGLKSTHIAFNDAYLKAEHGTVCYGSIEGEKYPKTNFNGDGIIVATPQGSTAYNHSAGGSILPLGHSIMAISTISSNSRPIRNVVNNQRLEINIHRDWTVGFADNKRVDKVIKMIVEPSGEYIRLVFIKGYNFETKRYKF